MFSADFFPFSEGIERINAPDPLTVSDSMPHHVVAENGAASAEMVARALKSDIRNTASVDQPYSDTVLPDSDLRSISSISLYNEIANTVPTAVTTSEDTALVFDGPNIIIIDDGFAADEQVKVSLQVTNGTLTLANLSGITIITGSNGSANIVIQGLESAVNTALDGLIFDPNADYEGPDTLSILTESSNRLEGHYTFDDGLTATDQAGGDDNGTFIGDATVVNDPSQGNVLQLDGAGDALQVAGDFNQPVDITLATWVNLASAPQDAEIIDVGHSVVIWYRNGSQEVRGTYFDGSGWLTVGAPIDLVSAGWTHIAYTIDSATNEHILYINGAIASAPEPAPAISYGAAPDTYFGTRADVPGNRDMDGFLDDARIYSRALSSSEIAALANDQATSSDSVAITVESVNDAPQLLLPGSAITFIEDGAAVVLDSGVEIFDTELTPLNNFTDASLTLARQGGANSEDIFGFNDGSGISLSGTTLLKNGQTIAIFETLTAGQLVVTFRDAGGETPTGSDVNAIARQITYANSSNTPPGNVLIDWVFSDGNTGNQGIGGAQTASDSTVVNINASNEAPALIQPDIEGVVVYDFENGTDSITATGPSITLNTPVTISGTDGFTTGKNGLLFPTGENTSAINPVSISTIPGVATSNEFSFSAQVRFDTGAGNKAWERIFDFGGGEEQDNVYLTRRGTSGDLVFVALDSNIPVGDILLQDVLTGIEGEWHHYGVTIDINRVAKVYIDGKIVGSTIIDNIPDYFNWDENYIGSSNAEPDKQFQGAMDDIAIFDRAITESEMAALAGTTVSQDFTLPEHAVNGSSADIVHGGDVDSSILTYSITSQEHTGAFAIDQSTGRITVADSTLLDFETDTTHNVTVRVSDGLLFDEETIQIALTDAPEPQHAAPLNESVDEDNPLTFSTADNNAITVSDSLAVGDALLRVELEVNDGVLALSNVANIEITAGADNSSNMTLVGTDTNIRNALDGLQFTPDAHFNGSATIDITTMIANVDSLAGRYTFENCEATDHSIGIRQDGTFNGEATTVFDPVRGEVLSLDGDQDKVIIDGLFGEPENVTLAAWVNLTSVTGGAAEIISLGNNIQLRLDGTGGGGAFGDGITLSYRTGGVWQNTSSNVFVAGTGWNHVAATFDDTTNTQTIYLNGTEIATSSHTAPIDYDLGVNTIIGAHGNGNPNYDFNGLIDEARIYTRALSATEIAELASPTEIIANLATELPAATQNIPITVNPINDVPVLSNIEALPASFTENGSPVGITGNLSLADIDDTNIESATISITANHVAADDQLLFTDQSGITGSYDSINGTLTLTGTASIADYQAAIRSIAYNNTSDNPGSQTRTISIEINDGDDASNILTRDIDIIESNDAPVLSNIEALPASFTENGSPVGITGNLSLADADDTNIESATISITANHVAADDQLLFTDQSGITGSYDSINGTLTLTGTASIADYQAAIRSITYNNTSDNPGSQTRTVSIEINDGDDASNILTRDIDIIESNDAPVLSATETTPALYTENEAPQLITNSTVIFDIDDTNIQSAIVTIDGNFAALADALIFVDQSGITGSYDSISGELSLTGSATLAEYEAAIQSVRYVNTSDNPSDLTRTVSFIVNDGDNDSNITSREILFTAENDAPVLSAIETPPASFIENGSPVGITANLSLTDSDDTNIESATIYISNNYVTADDLLLFNDQSGITGNYDYLDGILSLSGSASKADYQAAIRSITYYNTSDNPSAQTRTVSFVVNDGDNNSNTVTRDIVITVQNDAPVLIQPGIEGTVVYDFERGTDSITGTGPSITVNAPVTVSGSDGFSTGKNGLLFPIGDNNSITNPVSINTIPGIATSNEFSFSAQARFDAGDGSRSWERIFDFGGGELQDNLVLSRYATSNSLVFQAFDGATQVGEIRLLGALSGIDSEWHQYGVTIDTSGLAKVYIDGQVVGSTQLASTPDYSNWDENYIGSANWEQNKRLQGAIDDIAIFDRAITESEMAALASTTVSQDFILPEHAVNGSSADIVQGGDVDSTALTYSIPLQEHTGAFAIDPSTGRITVADSSLLDFETDNIHDVIVRVTDGLLSDEETYQIRLTDSPEPQQTAPLNENVNEDNPLTFSTVDNNVITVSDGVAVGDALLRVELTVTDGVLELANANNVEITAGANNSSSMIIIGTDTNIRNALDGLQFKPDPHFNGNATLNISTMIANVDALIGRYTFEDCEAIDHSIGIRQDGTFNRDATTVFDPVRGEVLSLDGDFDKVIVDGLFEEPENVTLAAWVNLTSVSGGAAEVISLGNNVQLRLDGSGGGAFGDGITLSYRNGGVWENTASNVFIEGTGWNHVAATFDDTNNVQKVYLNGTEIATSSRSASIVYDNGINTIIGAHGDASPGYNFHGLIDEVRIYNRALSATEIAELASPTETIANLATEISAVTQSVPITVNPINDQPVFATLDDNPVFLENSSPVILDTDAAFFDTDINRGEDNFDLTTLVLQRSGAANTDDVFSAADNLVFQNNGDIELSGFNIGQVLSNENGRLEIVFNATAVQASIDETLASIAYSNSNENPPSSVTIEYSMDDANGGDQGFGGSLTATGSILVGINPINDAPVLSNIEAVPASFAENEGSVGVTGNLSVADADDTNIESATISITANHVAADDQLLFTDQSGITGSFDSITGTLTLTGTATTADYQTAIRSITYNNTSDNPGSQSRTVSIEINDGDDVSNILSRNIGIFASNDAPVLSNIEALPASFNENGSPVGITGNLSVADIDDTNIESATISITANHAAADDQLLFTNQSGISGTYDSANGTLTLSGSASKADYQAAIRSITYNNTSDNPGSQTRTVSIEINDGDVASNILTRDIDIFASNDAPVLSAIETIPALYTENDAPLQITNSTVIFDIDDTNIESAIVAIDGNFAALEDALIFVDQSGITGSYDSISGELSLTGSATLTDYEAAIQSIRYINTSDNPSDLTRTVSFIVNDGDNNSNSIIREILFTAENDAPVLSNIEALPATYTENGSPIGITGNISLADIDDTNIESATISIRNNLITTEDSLIFIDRPGITGTYNASTGTLTLSGSASVTDYQSALRSITYSNASDNPDLNSRTISFSINDGESDSNALEREIAISSINDAPVVTNIESTAASYFEGNAPVSISNSLTLTDLDDFNIESAKVAITGNFTPDEDVLLFTDQRGISGSFDAINGILSLSGSATKFEYEEAIRSIDYNNTSDNPNILTRTVTIDAYDGTDYSNSVEREIKISPVNDAPTISSANSESLQYVENSPEIEILTDLNIADPDNIVIQSAQIVFTENFSATEDRLLFTNTPSISGSVDPLSGALTLSGQGSITDYEAAIRSITYINSSDNPDVLTRTLHISVNDGSNDSNTIIRHIQPLAINDAPVARGSTLSISEDSNYTLNLNDFGFEDRLDEHGFASVLIKKVPVAGMLTLNNQPVVNDQVILAEQITMGNLLFTPAPDTNGLDYAEIEFLVIDDGGTALNGANTSTIPATIKFNVESVNDAPQGTDNTIIVSEDTVFVFSRDDFGFTDLADNDSFAAVTITSVPAFGSLTLDNNPLPANTLIDIEQIDNGLLRYTPGSDINGSGYHGLSFRVHDNGSSNDHGPAADQTDNIITFDILGINDPPLLTTNDAAFDEGSENTLNITHINAVDPDNSESELVFTVNTLPLHGELTINGTTATVGSTFTLAQLIEDQIMYTHDGSETNADFLDINVTDGNSLTDDLATNLTTGRFSFEINEVIDAAPQIRDESVTMAFYGTYDSEQASILDSGEVTLASSAITNNPNLVVSIETQPEHGDLNITPNGAFVYSHNGAFAERDSFQYRVTNEDGIFAVATVTITIEPKPQAALEVPTVQEVPIIDQIAEERVVEQFESSTDNEDNTELATETDQQESAVNAESENASEQSATSDTATSATDFFAELAIDSDQPTNQTDVLANLAIEKFRSFNLSAENDNPLDGLQDIGIVKHNIFSQKQLDVDSSNSISNISFNIITEVTTRTKSEVVNSAGFLKTLQILNDDFKELELSDQTRHRFAYDSSMGVSLSATAGILAWVLRGGALFASVMAYTPMWSNIDPLRILKKQAKKRIPKKTKGDVEDIFD